MKSQAICLAFSGQIFGVCSKIFAVELQILLDILAFYDIIIKLIIDAVIAQSVERILGKDEVPGSNPGNSSR